jgi:hypothetical protein
VLPVLQKLATSAIAHLMYIKYTSMQILCKLRREKEKEKKEAIIIASQLKEIKLLIGIA